MGVTPLEAARLGDQIEHTFAMTGLLAGLVVGLVLTGALLLAAGATVATGGAAAVVIGGLIAGVAGGGLSGMKIGQMFTGTKGPIISPGSPNTFIGGDAKKAARAVIDQVACKDHSLKPIATGSLDVYINNQPAARKTDKTACDGKIAEAYPDVYFGGPTGQYLPISSEVPGWLVTTLEWAAIIGTVIATGGAILTVGFGAALGGLAGGYLGGLAGGAVGGKIGQFFFGEKGKVIGEEIGGFIGSTLGSSAGEKVGARLESALPSSVLAKLPGETAVNTLKTRMSDPANFAPGENPAFWTGPGSRDAAIANGNSTMEHTLGGQSTEAYVNGQKMPWEQSKPIWTESSTNYANEVGKQYGTMDPNTGLPITGGKAGEPVTVYVSENANPNSVYFTTEKPLLQSYGVNIVEVMVPAPVTP